MLIVQVTDASSRNRGLLSYPVDEEIGFLSGLPNVGLPRMGWTSIEN
jgi:hypothetical protein